MRIVNQLDRPISYELKGGPLKMTMSTCDLGPGEEEVWTSPYRVQRIDVSCELHVFVGDEEIVVQAPDDADVTVVSDAGAVVLKVS